MKRTLLISAVCLASCNNAPSYTQDDFNPLFAAWTGVKIGMDGEQASAVVKEKFGKSIDGPGGLNVKFTKSFSDGAGYVLASQEGALDSLISAQQVYVKVDGGKVSFVGLRHKCQRGETAGQWSKSKCP